MNPQRPTVLVADDQRDVCQALRLLFKAEGMECVAVEQPAAALDAARRQRFDIALIDLNYTRDTTTGAEGLELVRALKQIEPALPVVVMTAWGTIGLAVEAMRGAAADFIEKPWDNQRLINVLRHQIARAQQAGEATPRSPAAAGEPDPGTGFIARSAAMKPVLALLERIAPSDANVLVLGESGTGKGLLAQHIHATSRRAASVLVKVNMGGIAESVFESEMFGHVRGAFTDAKSDRIGRFQLADGGGLFLDEIATIPMALQPKLLRVIEDREFERVGSSRTVKVDVRLISATNANLELEVARGTFRRDLLFRLNTVEVRLPPLRERQEDIAPLAAHFLGRFAERYARPGLRLAPSAITTLQRHDWPGNIRELSHVIERAVLLARGEIVEADDLVNIGQASWSAAAEPGDDEADLSLDRAEERLVRQALERAGGNIQKASDLLGLSRAALYRRLEKYAIAPT